MELELRKWSILLLSAGAFLYLLQSYGHVAQKCLSFAIIYYPANIFEPSKIVANVLYRHEESVCWDSNMGKSLFLYWHDVEYEHTDTLVISGAWKQVDRMDLRCAQENPPARCYGLLLFGPENPLVQAFYNAKTHDTYSKCSGKSRRRWYQARVFRMWVLFLVTGNLPKLTQIVRASIILVIVYGIWDFKELFLHQDEFSPETLGWWIVMLIDILIDSIRGFFIASVYCFRLVRFYVNNFNSTHSKNNHILISLQAQNRVNLITPF